ncbi:uncharacterized protein LOC144133867 isoform X3 [Amblyomma americanum]
MSKIFLELGFIVSEEVRQQRDGYSGALALLPQLETKRSWKMYRVRTPRLKSPTGTSNAGARRMCDKEDSGQQIMQAGHLAGS